MKKILTYITSLIISIHLLAQQYPIDNQFIYNKAAVFRSYAGLNQNTEIFLTLQQRLLGFEGAPKLAHFYIGGDFSENMGWAFDLISQSSGNISQIYLNATYAYFIQFSENVFLTAALTPTLYSAQLNIANVQSFGYQLDPILNNTTNFRTIAPDIGVSLAFYANGFNFAIAVPQTIGFKAKLSGQNYTLDRTFMGLISYQYKTGNTTIEPFFFATSNQQFNILLSGGINFNFNKQFLASINYWSDGRLGLSAGGIMSRNLFISYTYDFGLYGLMAATSGNHTITIGFIIDRSPTSREPAIFPPTSIDQTLIDLQEQIDDLEKQLRNERQKRAKQDQKLNQRIDSLKQALNTPQQQTQTQQPPQTQQQTQNQQTKPQQNQQTQQPQQDLDEQVFLQFKDTATWKQVIISPTIQFGLNSSRLLSSSYSELDKYATLLKNDPTLKMFVAVHTDNLGAPQYKKRLSEARAKAIKDYLVKKGVNPDQIITYGFGGKYPIAPNSTLEGRRKNNRVEIGFNKKVLK